MIKAHIVLVVILDNVLRIIAPVLSNKLLPCSVLSKINNAVYKPLPFIRYSPIGNPWNIMITSQNMLDVE